jgi:hypothetical protein
MSSNVIKCHQMSSNVIKCHQMSSNVVTRNGYIVTVHPERFAAPVNQVLAYRLCTFSLAGVWIHLRACRLERRMAENTTVHGFNDYTGATVRTFHD